MIISVLTSCIWHAHVSFQLFIINTQLFIIKNKLLLVKSFLSETTVQAHNFLFVCFVHIQAWKENVIDTGFYVKSKNRFRQTSLLRETKCYYANTPHTFTWISFSFLMVENCNLYIFNTRNFRCYIWSFKVLN